MLMKKMLMLVLCTLLMLCPLTVHAEQEKPDILGEFTTIDIDGNEITQSIIRDNALTLVNVWGTFCPPCIEEMPHLGELAEEYSGKVSFLGILCDVVDPEGNIDEGTQKLAQEIVVATKAGTYTHILPTRGMNERVLYSINAVPTTFFLNEKGQQVGNAITGSRNKEDWTQIINETLASMATEN